MGIVFLSPLLLFSCDSKFTTLSVSTSHLLSLRILIVQYSLNNAGRRSRGLFTLNTFNPPHGWTRSRLHFSHLPGIFIPNDMQCFFFFLIMLQSFFGFSTRGQPPSVCQGCRTEEQKNCTGFGRLSAICTVCLIVVPSPSHTQLTGYLLVLSLPGYDKNLRPC